MADAVRDILPPVFSEQSRQPRTRLYFVDWVDCLAGNFEACFVANFVACRICCEIGNGLRLNEAPLSKFRKTQVPCVRKAPDSQHRLRLYNCETIGRFAVVRALVHSMFVLLEAIVTEDTRLAHQMAVKSAGILTGFALYMRKLEGSKYFRTVLGIWQMAVYGISIVEEFMSPETWQLAKTMFCVELRINGYSIPVPEPGLTREFINLSFQIFVAHVEPFPYDPERMHETGTEPVPEWFANRVFTEFKSMNLNPPKYASNDAFYRAAWDCVRPMAPSKQKSKKDTAWAGAKKKIQRALQQVAADEQGRIAFSVQKFVKLRADYRQHGAIFPQNMYEGLAVSTMIGMCAGHGSAEIETMKEIARAISPQKAKASSSAPVAVEAPMSRKALHRAKLRQFLEEIVLGVVASVPAAAKTAQWVEGVALQVCFQRGARLTGEEMVKLLGVQAASLQRREDRNQVLCSELEHKTTLLERTQARLNTEKERTKQQTETLDQTQANLQRAEQKAAECAVWRREAESASRALYSAQQTIAAAGAWLSEEVHSCQLEISAVATGLEEQAMHASDDCGACCICLDAAADHALVPCGHVCVCGACVSKAGNQCPLCRQGCDGAQAVFWA